MTMLDPAPPPAPPAGLEHAARQILAGLGEYGSVAANLAACGIRGTRSAPTGCPVATLLHTRLGARGLTNVRVSTVCIELTIAGGRHVEFATPAHIALFVDDFDLGLHPALETAA
jgi:hypothetical protein